jgi:excisionase family DNA binding protein
MWRSEMRVEGEANPNVDSQAEHKLLLTIPEVAQRLGMGRTFVYELIMKGEIPSIKLGRARRVPARALEEFVACRMKEILLDRQVN